MAGMQGMGMGAMQGGLTGSSVAPGIGTIIGAGLGAASGAMSDREKKKQAEQGRPKRRRLKKLQDALSAYQQQKLAGNMTLAQSAFNFGQNVMR